MTTELLNTIFFIIVTLIGIVALIYLIKLISKAANLVDNLNDEINRNKDNVASAISNFNDITTIATSIALDVNEVTSSINTKSKQLDALLHSMQKGQQNVSKVKSTVNGINSVMKFFNKFRNRG